MTRLMRFGGRMRLLGCLLLSACAGDPMSGVPNHTQEADALRQLERSRFAAGDAMRSMHEAFQITALNIAYADLPAYKALRADLAPGGRVDVHVDLRQGRLSWTGQDTDVAIQGRGFFRVISRIAGGRDSVAHTREGTYFRDAWGHLTFGRDSSYTLDPPVTVPITATASPSPPRERCW